MYKLIDSSSFFDQEELQVTILSGPGFTDGLVKAAADERVQSYVMDQLKIQPGKMYLHINAMGAGEFYGPNRNGDYFPEETLKAYYKTFETSPAHVFRHHVNKDPARAIGRVIFALYNERMHRVELVAEVDRNLGSDVENRIAQGDFPATSMACKTPYDICSICNNKAHTRQEYCVHLKQHLGRQMPEGKRVMAINSAPLKFFDISIVVKPADITSSILQKVANEDPVISSALLAEEEGLEFGEDRIKSASIAKVSELIKEIEGYVQGADSNMENILSKIEDPDVSDVNMLKSVPLDELLQVFGELGISPSLKFLAEVIAHRLGHDVPDIGNIVLKTLQESKFSGIKVPSIEMETEREVDPMVKQALQHYQVNSSYFPEFIEKRASVALGYSGMGPKIELNDQEIAARQRMTQQEPGFIDSLKSRPGIAVLLTIGGAALWAKAYINSIIEKRMAEIQPRSQSTIVKMASMSAGKELSLDDLSQKAQMKVITKTVSAINGPNSKLAVALKVLSAAHGQITKA